MKTTTKLYEPYRYLANAKEIIKTKLKIEDGLYNDAKYAKMAANTAYNGVLFGQLTN